MRIIELTGKRFGRLIVVGKTNKRICGKIVWECICDCGNTVEATGNHLCRGGVKSCGCIMIKHGHNRIGRASGTYKTWIAMSYRCNNPNCDAYKHYGGRGITVCEEWKDFANFLNDMGERPKGTSIDRINVELGYFKENCRWATRKEQANNIRNNRKVYYKGEMLTVSQISDILGVSRDILYGRLKRAGWNSEKVEKKIKQQCKIS